MNPSLSIIVGCKDRIQNLLTVISSWVYFVPHIVQEIIIIDWESNPPIVENVHLRKQTSPIAAYLRIIRVEKVQSWRLSSCLNFAVRFVRTDAICKLDCDYKLHPNFFNAHSLTKTSFFHGNYKMARNENEKHLNGALLCWKSQFDEVGGYNEYLSIYGYDDSDLYNRLQQNGNLAEHINFDYISHIEHSNELRAPTHPHPLRLQILTNMFLAKNKPWSKEAKKMDYRKVKENHYEVSSYLSVSTQTLNSCIHNAKRCILNDDYQLSWQWTDQKSVAFVDQILDRKKRNKTLVLTPLNGLGNRLRAISSAGVVAEKLGYLLVIRWIPDLHCHCEFKELFQAENLLVGSQEWQSKVKDSTVPDLNPSQESIPSEIDKKIKSLVTNTWDDAKILPLTDELNTLFINTACILNSKLTSYKEECDWMQKNIRLQPHLQKKVEQWAHKWNLSDCIGVHVRRGQPSHEFKYESSENWTPSQREKLQNARGDSHFLFFMQEMERIWKVHPQQKFFLSADRESTYRAFEITYPQHKDHILTIPRSIYDRSLIQLQYSLCDMFCLSKCKEIIGSSWSSFTEMAARFKFGMPLRFSGLHFNRYHMASFQYLNSCNVGDNIQTLAALQFYKQPVRYLLDRDQTQDIRPVVPPLLWSVYHELDKLDSVQPSAHDDAQTAWSRVFPTPSRKMVKIIANGWFDGRLTTIPYPPNVYPLFISVHVNEDPNLFKTREYKELGKKIRQNTSFFDSPEKIGYWKRWAPIGCRDIHTVRLFQKYNIPAYHSGCLTLSLERTTKTQIRNSNIYVVDVHTLYPTLFNKLVPVKIQKEAIYKTHIHHGTHEEKEKIARNLMELYQTCRYVITSRLHSAFVCLAYGTPVLFLHPHVNTDVRFRGDEIVLKLLGKGSQLPSWWSFENPNIPSWQQSYIKQIRARNHRRIEAFLENKEYETA